MSYDQPPPTSPLVVMADVDRAVTRVIQVEIPMIINVCPEWGFSRQQQQILVCMIILFFFFLFFHFRNNLQIPDCATTQEMRMKSITPQMLNILRIKTPSIHPNLTRMTSCSVPWTFSTGQNDSIENDQFSYRIQLDICYIVQHLYQHICLETFMPSIYSM